MSYSRVFARIRGCLLRLKNITEHFSRDDRLIQAELPEISMNGPVKVASFNVNGIRARLPLLVTWLEREARGLFAAN